MRSICLLNIEFLKHDQVSCNANYKNSAQQINFVSPTYSKISLQNASVVCYRNNGKINGAYL